MLRNLYGGAATIVLPAEFVDVSTLRQVPDHQECFFAANTGQLVVIELLQIPEDPADAAQGIEYR